MMEPTYVIPTSQAAHLAERIKTKQGIKIVLPGLNRDGKHHFPDGEIYAKIPRAEQLKNKKVVVLHSGAPNPNDGLVELELILQILKNAKVQQIEVFFSYIPYAMQDKVFERGETNAAQDLVKKLVNYYGVKKLYAIDPHFGGRVWIKKYPFISLSAVSLLMERATEEFGSDLLFLSTDKGGKRRTGIRGMKKTRQNSRTVHIENPNALGKLIKGKTIAVIDDVIKTGGTLEKFYDECNRAGAKQIIALITHGVIPSGVERAKRTYRKLYLTNTIHQEAANVDIANLILNALSA